MPGVPISNLGEERNAYSKGTLRRGGGVVNFSQIVAWHDHFLRSTKEERYLISWATCDRIGFLCTQAKADPCFFVRSVGRPGVHLFSAILNDVIISLRKGCCLVNDVTISLRKGCCLVLRSFSDVREHGCSLVNKLYCPFIAV